MKIGRTMSRNEEGMPDKIIKKKREKYKIRYEKKKADKMRLKVNCRVQ